MEDEKNTIGSLLSEASEVLKGLPDASLASEVMLAKCLGVSREKLIIAKNDEVDADVGARFSGMVSAHARGEPVAYLTGVKEFYGLDFVVDKRVLIPRPETEHLVDLVLEKADSYGDGCRVLDVGTGSGCIAVTLAKKNPGLKVTASDVSAQALEVAKQNALIHGVKERIEFVKSDLLESVNGDFDIIAANLPYIGREKFNFVSKEAADFEPSVALYGGSDGLKLYGRLFEQIAALESRPRFIVGEFGFLQGENLRLMMDSHFPSAKTEIRSDYASIERIFVIEFPSP